MLESLFSKTPPVAGSDCSVHEQPSSGVLTKRFSENMEQIYRRILMPKCDFNKVALQLY